MDGLVDVFAHLGIGGKVLVEKLLRLGRSHVGAAAQTESAYAVDGGEVDGLAHAALVIGDLVERHVEQPGCGDRVNVLPLAKGVKQRLLLHDVGQNAQLNLAVVGRQEQVALRGLEGLADFPPLLGANRNVLQVGVVAAEPAGRGAGLAVAGMDASRFRVDHFAERVDVGAAQLFQLALLKKEREKLALVG